MGHQKKQSIILIKKAFEEVFKTNLLDETYTKEEVKNILNSLERTITNEIKGELSAYTNTNLLMMYQFFQQAEKWHLRLNVDISEMQNKELLQAMEKIEISNNIMNRTLEKKKLLNTSDYITNDFAEVLQKRLNQLESHNSKLEADLKTLEDNCNKLKNEKEALKLRIEIEDKQEDPQKNLVEIEVQTQNTFDDNSINHDECKTTANQLRNELMIAQSQLTLTNLELDRKFNDTAAYINMKNIITKKNEQVRELRDRLLIYEKEDDNQDNVV
ncbi:PREDICTED: leucine zipper transcription factor-like protein 1 isoform X2 [Diuraphis noxia]|uniref:leucine zipper transcription factor-like protein 1 isoform X2 n=1 Tax=Diuraphis noxia TaxID=143948 RepID=UPI0007636AEE|nr:PREDICTED: leucine zipper transcription factor-like protein 1 isoform X2 [Diuraphis noxia]XP_015366001.1 PREDICTED: leucine zipper transcription factor-like protein 1 isoform X2 [Diuraphis noxia]